MQPRFVCLKGLMASLWQRLRSAMASLRARPALAPLPPPLPFYSCFLSVTYIHLEVD
jgi:hypothetical protein